MGPVALVEKFIESGEPAIEVTKVVSHHALSQMLENDRRRSKERFKGIKTILKDNSRVYLINLNQVDVRKLARQG